MTKTADRYSNPRIVLTADDDERLSQLVGAASNSSPDATSELAKELDRAHVLTRGRYPPDIVRMSSDVEYRDETTGRIQVVTLVYPYQADIAEGRVSVLTPIGTALIGLAVGKSISWRTRTGQMKRLTVLKVRDTAAS